MGGGVGKLGLLSSPKGGGREGLATLEALYRQDLDFLNLPVKKWTTAQTTADGQPIVDVLVVGGGMAGIALAIALKHLGVEARLVDQAPADYEGPWDTTARMETLRSGKQLVGPALGFAHLTFRAYFVAQFGVAAWDALDKIPRVQWMDYLRWLKRLNSLEVRNDTKVTLVLPGADGVATVEVQRTSTSSPRGEKGEGAGGAPTTDVSTAPAEKLYARHVVLATGRGGLGGPWLPDWAAQIPLERRVHSADVWSGDQCAGKHVVVIGGGSSAMDCAATALEHGAAEVHLLIRRTDLPRVNKSKAAMGPGITHGYLTFSDAWKWRFRHYMNLHIPPPHGSTLRVSRHRNAFFHFGAPVEKVAVRDDGKVRIDTPKGSMATDFVVFATGYTVDWQQRPEFAPFAAHVLQWKDVYAPPGNLTSKDMSQFPYLGPSFEFREKVDGACSGLNHIHCFCYPATLSFGAVSGDIPQITDGARMLAQRLAGDLYTEEVGAQFKKVEAFEDAELDGSEWVPAVWPEYKES
jgi:FAD-dependent urate hydroxylase